MRSDRERLEDILERCNLLREHVAGRTEQLQTDPMLLAATHYWILIIGEAAAKVSSEFQRNHPEVPWRNAIGMRNILVHGYFHVDLDVMVDVVERDAPALAAHASRLLQELE